MVSQSRDELRGTRFGEPGAPGIQIVDGDAVCLVVTEVTEPIQGVAAREVVEGEVLAPGIVESVTSENTHSTGTMYLV
jgi:hypothetical protein